MKVKELIRKLRQLPQDDEICITCMSNNFCISDFEVHSPYKDGQAQEIILNCYIDNYGVEEQG